MEMGSPGAFYAVALATDEEYSIPTLVTICSLLENSNDPSCIQLYILLSGEFPEKRRKQIDTYLMAMDAPRAIYFNMQNAYNEVDLSIAHTSRATFFRLRLPSLLATEERCLYLDTDILVREDLTELFSLDLGDSYFASVTAAFYCEPQRKFAHEQSIDVPDLVNYPNAGVLVMNLAKMRADGLEDKFNLLVEKSYPMQDQDVLYKACYGHIMRLRPAFNALNGYGLNVDAYGEEDSFLPLAYTLEEWKEACEKPKIIHFARPEKPWFDYSLPFADEWWSVVFRMGLGEECFFRYMSRNIEYRNLLLSWREKEKWRLRDESIRVVRERDELKRKCDASNKDLAEGKVRIESMQRDLDRAEREEASLREKLKKANATIDSIKASRTFRIGSVVVFIPKKIRSTIRKLLSNF